MPSARQDVELDLQELQRLLSLSERPHVREELLMLIRREESLLNVDESSKLVGASPASQIPATASVVGDQKPKTHVSAVAAEGFITIHSYGWDQSDKSVTIYLTDDRLKNVQDLEPQQVNCQFDDHLVSLIIRSLKGRNFRFEINNLAYPINAAESSCKLKKDMVVLHLRKRDARHWDALTGFDRQQKVKESKKFETKPGEGVSDDPNASIMNLMKKMYEEGDDDMKRMINQSWTQSQDKKKRGGGDMFGAGDMPGMPEF